MSTRRIPVCLTSSTSEHVSDVANTSVVHISTIVRRIEVLIMASKHFVALLLLGIGDDVYPQLSPLASPTSNNSSWQLVVVPLSSLFMQWLQLCINLSLSVAWRRQQGWEVKFGNYLLVIW